MTEKKIRLGYSEMTVPVYTEKEILEAIEKEGLVGYAWGFKTPKCVWVYVDGQENNEIWDKIKPSMNGIEPCNFYDSNKLQKVNYYMLEDNDI
jgi:hypothetical protein